MSHLSNNTVKSAVEQHTNTLFVVKWWREAQTYDERGQKAWFALFGAKCFSSGELKEELELLINILSMTD